MWSKFFSRLSVFVLLTAIAGLPGVTHAQSAPSAVAVILPKKPEHLTAIYDSFRKKFAQLMANRPEPRFYLQTPNADYLSLRNSVRKAIALNADLILAFGTSAALAAKAETFETPILFADAVDPEAIGLVTQNKRDSQLATGVRGNPPLQTLFKLLRDMTTTLKLAVPTDGDPTDKQLTAVLKDIAARRGFEVVPVNLREKSPAEGLQAVVNSGANGILFIKNEDKHIAVLSLAIEKKMPVISIVPEMVDHGALLGLETSLEEQGEALAEMTVKVLDGAYPESIPVETPRKAGIVINLISAQKCELKVPFEVLSQATRVVR